LHQKELEKLELSVQRASLMVFSDFFEVLFRLAIFSNQDPNKSDILKFKEFLLQEVFGNLKF